MAKKQFKTESKRILDLMIHSIYTHPEIFLRELISNASDAIDKLYFASLTDDSLGLSRDDFAIDLAVNKDARTLTISDNGCGMTKDELEHNLGTIAKSGTLQFKQENDLKQDDIDIIGQFGVGFYSAFMVAKHITVISRAYGSEETYRWDSDGIDGYTIKPAQKDHYGTEIILTLKDNQEEENYDEFLNTYKLTTLVKKYSDYIRYPIRLDVETRQPKKDTEGEYETVIENKTLNSMIPIWRKNKSEVTQEEYQEFYKQKFFDFENPLRIIHTKVEGSVTYSALLYIPSRAPFDYYTKEYQKGLQLYSNGVMIMEQCADLLPDYFSFVKGLVDSSDLSLNISREMLQHDRQLKTIAANIEKKIQSELQKMLQSDREQYEVFFKDFGLQLKYGVYAQFGQNKDKLKDLILFYSMNEGKMVTLKEYTDAMKPEQKYIYYACGSSTERISQLPQLDLIKEKGFDALFLTDDVDEFALKMLMNYDNKEFKSVSDGDLGLESEEEKKEAEKQADEHKELFSAIKDALGDKVSSVRISSRLKSHPVCLSTEGALSLEMEKVLNAMPMENKVSAQRVLEINADHPIFSALQSVYEKNPDKLAEYANLLYTQALLIEGFPIEDPVSYTNSICNLIAENV